MERYELTRDAEFDLREIARYTFETWGKNALVQYRDGLKEAFKGISNGQVIKKSFSKRFPELLVTKYQYHYIFYLISDSQKPVIIGVIHERRDIVNRLGERLT